MSAESTECRLSVLRVSSAKDLLVFRDNWWPALQCEANQREFLCTSVLLSEDMTSLKLVEEGNSLEETTILWRCDLL